MLHSPPYTSFIQMMWSPDLSVWVISVWAARPDAAAIPGEVYTIVYSKTLQTDTTSEG